ncbi:MAG: tyrosine-type recombinase/integrase [Candidatus Bathyarchaeia archaeon]
MEAASSLSCPVCGSEMLYRDGLRYLRSGEAVQRYLCRSCGYRFSGKSEKTYNSCQTEKEAVQVCAYGAKNLDTAQETRTCAGERGKQEQEIKGKILELCLYMKRQGYSEETIRLNRIALKVLSERGANLYDPESVKDVIARQKWSPNRRKNVINAYTMFLKLNKMTWEPPRCTVPESIPSLIPTEQEIDCLIAAAPRKLSAFLLLIKETAMRRGEAQRIKWTDIDFERCTITLNEPEKRSNPRMWKVSPQLIAQLNALPKTSEKVFDCKPDSLKGAFLTLRKKQAHKLQNPRLLKIGFHMIRHWKATMLYHKTKDPLYVRDFLGHKSMKNTEKYVNIERKIFADYGNEEFTVKVAQTPQELVTLLEAGFEYVCQKDNLIFLRKRK